MKTQSGCFSDDMDVSVPIENEAEAKSAVSSIESDLPVTTDPNPSPFALSRLSLLCDALAQRVKILTWALVILTIWVFAKEMK